MSSGYEQIYEVLVPKLRECNFAGAAQRLGLLAGPDGSLSVRFLGRKYIIGADGVHPTDGRPVNVNNRSVLAYYTLSQGAGEPAMSFVPISHLTGSGLIFSSNTSWMADPLGKRFGEDFAAFRDAMDGLGAVYEGRHRTGGFSWLLRALPKIPVQIVYNEGDDEFPCEVQILFDKHAPRFLEFECLAFLQGCLVGAILKTSQSGGKS